MTAPVAPVTDCATGSGDKQSGDALAEFVSRPQVVKINAAALAWAKRQLCRAHAPCVNSHERTPIHSGLKPMWSRVPHKGTPAFYALKRVKDRMPA